MASHRRMLERSALALAVALAAAGNDSAVPAGRRSSAAAVAEPAVISLAALYPESLCHS